MDSIITHLKNYGFDLNDRQASVLRAGLRRWEKEYLPEFFAVNGKALFSFCKTEDELNGRRFRARYCYILHRNQEVSFKTFKVNAPNSKSYNDYRHQVFHNTQIKRGQTGRGNALDTADLILRIDEELVEDCLFCIEDIFEKLSLTEDVLKWENAARMLRLHLLEYIQKDHSQKLFAFLKHLSIEALRACIHLNDFQPKVYNAVARHDDPKAQLYLFQAMKASEIAAYIILQEQDKLGFPSQDSNKERNQFIEDIIQGLSLTTALDRHFALYKPESDIQMDDRLPRSKNNKHLEFNRSQVRYLQKMSFKTMNQEQKKEVKQYIEALGSIQPVIYPKSDVINEPFFRYYHLAQNIALVFNQSVSEYMMRNRHLWQIKDVKGELPYQRYSDFLDWSMALSKRIVIPAVLNAMENDDTKISFKTHLKSHMGFKGTLLNNTQNYPINAVIRKLDYHYLTYQPINRIFKASHLWHQNVNDIIDQIDTLNVDNLSLSPQWLPLSKRMTYKGKIEIVPLTSSNALKEEGRALDHCVGDYSASAYNQKSHFLSFRDAKTGENLSTAELTEVQPNDDRPPFLKVRQHRGYDNQYVSEIETKALKWYMKEIHDNPPDWEAIEKRREKLKLEAPKSSKAFIGYDFEDPEKCEAIFYIYRPYLPTKAERNMTYEAWLDSLDITKMIEDVKGGVQKTIANGYEYAV